MQSVIYKALADGQRLKIESEDGNVKVSIIEPPVLVNVELFDVADDSEGKWRPRGETCKMDAAAAKSVDGKFMHGTGFRVVKGAEGLGIDEAQPLDADTSQAVATMQRLLRDWDI